MSEKVHVVLDAMGGDNAPDEIVKGALDAVRERSDIRVTLVGQEAVVEKELSGCVYPKDQVVVKYASELIELAEPPVVAIRMK